MVYLLYHGILLTHVDGHRKQYVKTHECRREELLKHFYSTTWQHEVPYLCCDNCAAECECRLPDYGELTAFPVSQITEIASLQIKGSCEQLMDEGILVPLFQNESLCETFHILNQSGYEPLNLENGSKAPNRFSPGNLNRLASKSNTR